MPRVNKRARTIIVTAALTLSAVLMLQNMRQVTLRFVMWDATLPLALLLALVFACGAIGAWFWRRR